ncbi:nicotinate-nucleotide adenylyltransferase [Paracoccus sp. 1_MG-2023]|uniref:nicotinate-nucleotide adenylyltransferase n=1 Tax=unclassified Paracoccus (in: a-proteobacteria) TaxID=2688777 RepID=UPI001C09F9FD|nr:MULTISPECIES: nicotinate-nucleotide adenylyltransferase [unclassified Paracoccus (in: a-proteobacteria)]MBU2958646.1 nicotinate-nucleotide adenylyltransferase [Paracoccus sp. C2R09]MDO6667639.1 nicotinate-nucleotide adenylyltransferase [Paracoccus sp. 1_MG-2023]
MRHGFPIATPGQRIGILGGSFDPAHDGHLQISQAALSRLRLDRVWWLVSPGNPLKTRGPAPMSDRTARAEAIARDPRIVVTGIEKDLGTRMTADSLAALRTEYPHVDFCWLMGSDNLLQFHKWDRWRRIAATMPLAVLARPGTRLAARNAPAAQMLRGHRIPETRAALLPGMKAPAWVFLNLPMSPLSSTMIRAGG